MPYWSNDSGELYQGDVLEVLAGLPAGSVHCCVTSPPYWGLRDYGVEGQMGLESTPQEWVDKMVLVSKGLWRVLRDDATWWLNVGDSYCAAPAGNFGPDMPKPADGGAYRSNKPKVNYDGLKPKDLCLMPFRLALALQEAGWYVRSDICWAKKSPMPESVTDRPTSAWEHIFLLTKQARYFYDLEAVREPPSPNNDGKAGIRMPDAARKAMGAEGYKQNERQYDRICGANLRNVWHLGPESYAEAHFATFVSEIPRRCIKAGTSERGVCPACGAPWQRVVERNGNARQTGNDWQEGRSIVGHHGPSRPGSFEANTATTGWQPSCSCDAGDPVPATVLEPFAGSGTTCAVAQNLRRRWVGIELNAEYCDLAIRRIQTQAAQTRLAI